MDITLSWWAALLGLPLAIILILRKRNTTYARMPGAIVGCLVGGPSPGADVNIGVAGSQSVTSTVIRVLAASVCWRAS